jgi:uncharacterized protein DUF2071
MSRRRWTRFTRGNNLIGMRSEFDCRELLNKRLERFPAGRFHARTMLRHFALINYAVSPGRLAELIPREHFEVARFETDGGSKAFLSVVAFLDVDFNFSRIASKIKFTFYQTNHRAYIIEKSSQQPVVWFFGTNLGSRLVSIPRRLWKIPWHFTKYAVDCRFDQTSNRYKKYSYNFESKWCQGQIELRDTGEPVSAMNGFASLDEMKLILTQPVRGFYRRLDGQIGTYQVWHREMVCTKGVAENLYFSLYEKLGLLSKNEMQNPHSIFLCPKVEFDVHLPPKEFKTATY